MCVVVCMRSSRLYIHRRVCVCVHYWTSARTRFHTNAPRQWKARQYKELRLIPSREGRKGKGSCPNTRPNCKNCGWACQLASNKSPLRGKEKEKQKYTHTHTLYYYVLLCIYAFPLNNETRERETFFLWSSSVNNPNNALAGK